MCLHMSTCCFCIPLGIGVFLIAVNNIVLIVLQIICASMDITREIYSGAINMTIYGFEFFAVIMLVVALLFGLLFLTAICRDDLCCMVPWKIYSLVNIVVNVCILSFLVFVFASALTQTYHIVYFIATCFYLCMTVYAINVVHSYLNRQLDEEEQYVRELNRQLEARRKRRQELINHR